MKKYKYLLMLLFSFFSFNLITKAADYTFNGEQYLIVKNGDTVCANQAYSYGAALYDYDSAGEFVYLGKFGANSSNCFTVDITKLGATLKESTDEFIVHNAAYGYGGPVVAPYYQPKFTLSCDVTQLKYGQNANCTLSYKTYQLVNSVDYSAISSTKTNCVEDLKFPYDNSSFQLVDYKSTAGDVSYTNGTFNITNGTDICSYTDSNTILNFTITPVSKEVSGEKIPVDLKTMEYEDVLTTNITSASTNINVTKDPTSDDNEAGIKNPNTLDATQVSLVLVVILISSFLIVPLAKKLKFYGID